MRLKNEFSWSFSRASTFAECQKKYWYTYYGSWEGWPKTPYDERPSIDPLAAHLYMLKHIQKLSMFVGSAVHQTIEHFLKKAQSSKKLFSLDELLSHARTLFEKGFTDSQKQAWRSSPKKHANLFEFYYGTGIADSQKAAALAKVETSLTNWHASAIVQQLAFHPKSTWLSIEELSFFLLKETFKIVVVMDLAISWQASDGQKIACLFDWKTGEESEKTENQLICYALFANRTWGFSFDKMILVPFYLFKNSYQKIGYQQQQPLDLEKIKRVEAEIETSCAAMVQLHKTDPKPDVRLFAYAEDRKVCTNCPFKEVCLSAGYEPLSEEELRKNRSIHHATNGGI